MKWLKANWKAFALLGAGAILMTVLTLVILSQREERGFMVRECVADSGDHAATKWSTADMPVPVYLSVSEKRLEADVQAAIEYWSPYLIWAGYAKFIQDPPDPAIIVDSMPASDPPHGSATLKWIGACRIRHVDVKIPMPMLAGNMRTCVVRHELGHALGLDHDDDEDSVMNAHRGPLFRCEITEEDQALLGRTYGDR
jgi:hypothetical protein